MSLFNCGNRVPPQRHVRQPLLSQNSGDETIVLSGTTVPQLQQGTYHVLVSGWDGGAPSHLILPVIMEV